LHVYSTNNITIKPNQFTLKEDREGHMKHKNNLKGLKSIK